METPLLLIEKIVASVGIGLLIGLEREWAHKEAGVRSFTIAALLGTLSWLVSPTIASVEVGVVVIIIIFVNLFSLLKNHPLEITTSLALAATNVLGLLVGMGAFFLAFTCAILVAALLSWKTELVAFTSKLTVSEICGLSAVLTFGLLFLSLTVVSGLGQKFFGAVGFVAIVVIGALASTAASAVLVGGHLHLLGASPAAFTLFFATLVGLVENVVIFSTVTRDRTRSVRLALLSSPMVLVGGLAMVLALLLW